MPSQLNKETFVPSVRYLLLSTTYEIPSFICYLAVPVILFPLSSVKAENMFNQLKIVRIKLLPQMSQYFLNALIRIRHDSDCSGKTKGAAVDKLRNTKQRKI